MDVFRFIFIFICNILTFDKYAYHAVAKTWFKNVSCGVDNSAIDVVFEGVANIQTYPWMGYLVYVSGKKRFTTVVVLVTKQIVLATATEIDKLPKIDFRTKARVVLGHGCSGLKLRVRDYTYHPEFSRNTYSALALVQLDMEGVPPENLRPICPPPPNLIDPEFYSMTLNDNCNMPRAQLYEMKFVDSEKCKSYYRKSGLDISFLWPTHTACAQAKHGGECVWRSGAALAVYQGKRWHLVGFGIYGPGCEAPARFLDYGMYHQWVRKSILRIGRPTITRVGDNEIILRRSLSNLQRFGPCDRGEMKSELYTDHTRISVVDLGIRKVRYNMTIYASIEYSCVVFRATSFFSNSRKPKLRLRRWCAGPMDICSDYQHLEIDFYVEITFAGPMTYDLKAYGKKIQAIDTRRAMVYLNTKLDAPEIPSAEDLRAMVLRRKKPAGIEWYVGRNLDHLVVPSPAKNSTEATDTTTATPPF